MCQTASGVEIRAVVGGDLNDAAVGDAVAGNLRRAGLESARATVSRVDRIPRHPETGKVTRFIPLRRC